MTTPSEPDDDATGEERPDEAVSTEDALWRSIIDNYGERPQIDEPEVEVPPSPRGLVPPSDDAPEELRAGPEDHFVPPPPPPLPSPPPARLLAWLGLFGVPVFVLVALVASLPVASWLGLILMAWFVGGFVYLVASMRPGPGHDHDDGARL